MSESPYVFELAASGPGSGLRDRLTDAVADVRPDVIVEFIGVIVRLTPVTDGRPAAVCIRRALKRLLRRDGLSARWTPPREPLSKTTDGEAVMSRPAASKKRKARQRAADEKNAKCDEMEAIRA